MKQEQNLFPYETHHKAYGDLVSPQDLSEPQTKLSLCFYLGHLNPLRHIKSGGFLNVYTAERFGKSNKTKGSKKYMTIYLYFY